MEVDYTEDFHPGPEEYPNISTTLSSFFTDLSYWNFYCKHYNAIPSFYSIKCINGFLTEEWFKDFKILFQYDKLRGDHDEFVKVFQFSEKKLVLQSTTDQRCRAIHFQFAPVFYLRLLLHHHLGL